MARQVAAVESNPHEAMENSARVGREAAAPRTETPPPSAAPPGAEAAQGGSRRPGGKFLYHGGDRPLSGYTIKRGVGHGGFGEIYYATSDAGKEVALKLVRRNLDIELRGVRHCLNLKHPNLLDLYDLRQDDRGDTWIVMEYVAGESLEQAIDTHPDGLPLAQALAWFHGIGAGVAYLHDRGIVHRDLKPGNVFSSEGLVKVGDYGLSKFISCSRRSGHTESIGTVHYMAPEVAGGRYGKEIDVYAMGVMLYEMLTGRVPFEGESVGEVLMKHLTAEPDLSMLAEPYRSVVARALEKDPARRFASVGEMLAALPPPAEAPPGSGRIPSAVAGATIGAGGEAFYGGARRPNPWAKTAAHGRSADEEPIARWFADTWWKLRDAWHQANLNTPAKVILLVLVMFLLLSSAQVLVPLAIVALVCYGVYRIVRAIVLQTSGPAAAPGPYPRAPAPPPRAAASPFAGGAVAPIPPPRDPDAPASRRHHARRERAVAALVVKPTRERVAELLGSMILGALVAGAMCVVMLLLKGYRSGFPRPELCAWLGLVSIAGTWAVLVPAKLWEGTRGEPILRRFGMMVVGLGLGAAAYGLAVVLMVGLPAGDFPEAGYRLPDGFYGAGGHPLLLAHLAAFGALLLVMRWWRQADPLRRTRLSLVTLLLTVIAAGIVAGLTHFPQPWLSMVAATISVAVQISAPLAMPHRSGNHGTADERG